MTGSLENNAIDALLEHRTSPTEHDDTVWLDSLGMAA